MPPRVGEVAQTIAFWYPASDPSNVWQDEEGHYRLPTGDDEEKYTMRLWTKPGNHVRNKESVKDGGDYVGWGPHGSLEMVGYDGTSQTIVLWLECLRPSDPLTNRIVAVSTRGSQGEGMYRDEVCVTVGGMDVDVDSDNNGVINTSIFVEEEDVMEEDSPGMLLGVNDDNDDVGTGDTDLDKDNQRIDGEEDLDDMRPLRISLPSVGYVQGGTLSLTKSGEGEIRLFYNEGDVANAKMFFDCGGTGLIDPATLLDKITSHGGQLDLASKVLLGRPRATM